MTEKIKEALNALIENKDTDLYEELIHKEDIQEPAFAEEALKQGIFCPAELYKAASPKVRDNLIELLEGEKNNTLNINGILLALAAIGDEVVVEAFKKWEENPPAWRSKIYVGPAEYAMESGWCIENGNKKELTHDSCYALQRVQACETNGNVYGGPSKDRCPHCGSKYEEILVLDGKDSRLAFLGIDGIIKIKTCKACLPWEKYIFSKYEENGESRIIYQESGAGRRIEDENWKTEKCFVLSESSVAKQYCSEWEGSAVGGAPKYVDDANYAICPECGKRMRHLAQLGEEYTGYGNIYVQICKECKITATLYQQS